MGRTKRSICWVCAFVIALSFGATAPDRFGNWADTLFSESGHDFGPVPRGSVVRHPFVLTNRLNEPITIHDTRASCGCTAGHIGSKTLAPGEQTVVEAIMDTRNFVGRKDTVLFVTLTTASGRMAEARLAISSTILSDVVLNPGTLHFGSVSRGETPELSLTIDRVGAPGWGINRMVTRSKALDGRLTQSTPSHRQTTQYTLTVALKPDAPTGWIQDEIHLYTNDPEAPVLPVQVSARVVGNLTASPNELNLGPVRSSRPVNGRVILRGRKPFSIVDVEGQGEGFEVSVDERSKSTRKPLHILTIQYDPEQAESPDPPRRTFRVVTDLPGEPPFEVTATASRAS